MNPSLRWGARQRMRWSPCTTSPGRSSTRGASWTTSRLRIEDFSKSNSRILLHHFANFERWTFLILFPFRVSMALERILLARRRMKMTRTTISTINDSTMMPPQDILTETKTNKIITFQ